MNWSVKLTTLLIMTAIMSVGCSSEFQPIDRSTCDASLEDCSTDSGQERQGVTPPGDGGEVVQPRPTPDNSGPTDWSDILLRAAIKGGAQDGFIAVDIDTENDALLLITPVPFINASLMQPESGNIGEIEGTQFSAYQLQDGSSALAVSIPFGHVLKGVQNVPSKRLPNGDPLPTIPSGELPAAGAMFAKGKMSVTVYVGASIAAIYVTSPVNPYLALDLPIRNEADNKVTGTFATIPAKDNHDGGFFVSTVLSEEIARAIDERL